MTREALEIACRDGDSCEIGRMTWCISSCNNWVIHGDQGFRVCPFDVRNLLGSFMAEMTTDQVLRLELSLMPNVQGVPMIEMGDDAFTLNYFFPHHEVIDLDAVLEKEHTSFLSMEGNQHLLNTLLEIYQQPQVNRLEEESFSLSRMIGNERSLSRMLDYFLQAQDTINNGVTFTMQLVVSTLGWARSTFVNVSDGEQVELCFDPVKDVNLQEGNEYPNIFYSGTEYLVMRDFSVFTAFPLLPAAFHSRFSSGDLPFCTDVIVPFGEGMPVCIQYCLA